MFTFGARSTHAVEAPSLFGDDAAAMLWIAGSGLGGTIACAMLLYLLF
jgi:hypothetical protein